jgi:hypothetical protein
MDMLIGLSGSMIGLTIYWVGYAMGYKQGIRSGIILRDIDPRIRHWWLKAK